MVAAKIAPLPESGPMPSAAMRLTAYRDALFAAQPNELDRYVYKALDHLVGMSVIAVCAIATVLATAPDRPSLYRRTALLVGGVALSGAALGLKDLSAAPAAAAP